MASTRIRYTKTNQDGLLQSAQKFQHPTNGERYKILLNTNEHQWSVIEDNTDIIAASGHQKDLHRMKIEVKKALNQLGVNFSNETRQGKNTNSSVGATNES